MERECQAGNDEGQVGWFAFVLDANATRRPGKRATRQPIVAAPRLDCGPLEYLTK